MATYSLMPTDSNCGYFGLHTLASSCLAFDAPLLFTTLILFCQVIHFLSIPLHFMSFVLYRFTPEAFAFFAALRLRLEVCFIEHH